MESKQFICTTEEEKYSIIIVQFMLGICQCHGSANDITCSILFFLNKSEFSPEFSPHLEAVGCDGTKLILAGKLA